MSVDDKDVFASALSETPAAEAPADAAAEPKPEDGQPRDEHGRFVPKAADAEKPDPVTGEKSPGEEAQPETGEKSPPEEAIPSWRLREETQRRRQAEEQLAQLSAREAQLRHYFERQQQQQQQPKLPDLIEQPAEFAQYLTAMFQQEREQLRLEFEQHEIKRSLWRADRAYGEEFRKAYEAFDRSGDDLLLARVKNAFDQGEEIMSWYRERSTLREIGDPKAYRAKLEAELLADPEFRKKFGETLRGQTAGKPSNITSLPNLARAPGSAGGSGDDYPTDEAGIFQSVTAGLSRR